MRFVQDAATDNRRTLPRSRAAQSVASQTSDAIALGCLGGVRGGSGDTALGGTKGGITARLPLPFQHGRAS